MGPGYCALAMNGDADVTLRNLSVVFLALSSLALPALAQDNREFRAWQAVCDADLGCKAETHHVGDDPGDYRFRLTRLRDESTWNLVLEVNVADPAEPYDIEVELSGGSDVFSRKVEAAAYGRESDLYLLGDDARMLMARLGPASEIAFSILDKDGGAQPARFSLSGLSASLLWIDEKQGRLGSPREAGTPPQGLMRVGAGADEQIPEEILIEHIRQGECEVFEDLPNGHDFIVADLGGERTLYLLPCFSGAYNFGYVAYVGSNGSYEPQWFADYSDISSWTATPFLVNPDWDGTTRRLTTFNRGRGLGDCGSIGEWRAYDGYLRLERFSAKDDCDGEGEPGQFPLVFEAKAKDG